MGLKSEGDGPQVSYLFCAGFMGVQQQTVEVGMLRFMVYDIILLSQTYLKL